MAWEWNEISQWKMNAIEGYGWTETDPIYLARLKLIQSQALQKQKAMLGRKSHVDTAQHYVAGDDMKKKRDKPLGWYNQPGWANRAQKCESFTKAKEKLLKLVFDL